MVKLNYLLPLFLLTSTSFAFLNAGLSKAQELNKHQEFMADIESYARNHGGTFSDVSDQQNIKTAKQLCSAIGQKGLSNSFEQFVSVAEGKSEGTQKSLGFFFAKSVEYYCPQYMEDLRNYIDTYR